MGDSALAFVLRAIAFQKTARAKTSRFYVDLYADGDRPRRQAAF
jgi:hypothetical protein